MLLIALVYDLNSNKKKQERSVTGCSVYRKFSESTTPGITSVLSALGLYHSLFCSVFLTSETQELKRNCTY